MPSASSIPSFSNECRKGAHDVRQHLTAQRGDAPATPGAGGADLVGVHEVHIEVAGAVVRELGDLAAHPQAPVPGKGPGEGGLDLVVEGADGEHVGVRVAVEQRGRSRRVGHTDERRGFRIEELAGATGHCRHPTDAVRVRPTRGGRLVGTVSRPGGRGPGRSWDRVEEGRDSTEQGAGSASRGDPQDSATERKPPMAGLAPAQVRVKRCGKSAPAAGATSSAR